MFFVFLGLFILFASFVIALISLFREQNTARKEFVGKEFRVRYEEARRQVLEKPHQINSQLDKGSLEKETEDTHTGSFFWDRGYRRDEIPLSGPWARALGENSSDDWKDKAQELSGEILLRGLVTKKED